VEWPAKQSYLGLVGVGVQEQAEDILVPPLLRNCLTFELHFFFLVIISPYRTVVLAIVLQCLVHSKNVYDDDNDDWEITNTEILVSYRLVFDSNPVGRIATMYAAGACLSVPVRVDLTRYLYNIQRESRVNVTTVELSHIALAIVLL